MSMNDDSLSNLIRQHATYHKASERLRAQVGTSMALEAETHPAAPSPVWTGGAARSSWRQRTEWRTALAGFALGVTLTIAMTMVGQRWQPGFITSLEAELVADHVRAIKSGTLTQVASTDRHTVKPWFQGKLDFAPTVLNLADDDFPLLGARIEQVHGEPAAVLVYTHRQHILSLFVWPTEQAPTIPTMQHNGFSLLNWRDRGMAYWLVSDMDTMEIERFARAWHGHATQLQIKRP